MQNRGCLIAMIIGGSAALVLGLTWFFYFLPQWKRVAASNVAFELERRLEAYHREFGQWPKGGNTDILLALRGHNPGGILFVREDHGFPIKANAFIDQWETPVRFETGADGRPRPVSAGPNRRHGDRDDIDASLARTKAVEIFGDGKIPVFEPEKPAGPATPVPSPVPPPVPTP